ncbi:MAG: LuxR C-terminal-related transcriptional regulator [Propionibacteriaceae bacterium]|jgi:DNA-binding NarL/FixJ family response regulator|nr:LuxR C-terminal-related transcriptional regulator [Propionibacteriaceae bacterium]
MSIATVPINSSRVPYRFHVARNSVDTREISRDDLRLLAVIATGIPLTSVAHRLDISDRTVRRRVRHICESLGLKSIIEAVAWAARRGLI